MTHGTLLPEYLFPLSTGGAEPLRCFERQVLTQVGKSVLPNAGLCVRQDLSRSVARFIVPFLFKFVRAFPAAKIMRIPGHGFRHRSGFWNIDFAVGVLDHIQRQAVFLLPRSWEEIGTRQNRQRQDQNREHRKTYHCFIVNLMRVKFNRKRAPCPRRQDGNPKAWFFVHDF